MIRYTFCPSNNFIDNVFLPGTGLENQSVSKQSDGNDDMEIKIVVKVSFSYINRANIINYAVKRGF